MEVIIEFTATDLRTMRNTEGYEGEIGDAYLCSRMIQHYQKHSDFIVLKNTDIEHPNNAGLFLIKCLARKYKVRFELLVNPDPIMAVVNRFGFFGYLSSFGNIILHKDYGMHLQFINHPETKVLTSSEYHPDIEYEVFWRSPTTSFNALRSKFIDDMLAYTEDYDFVCAQFTIQPQN